MATRDGATYTFTDDEIIDRIGIEPGDVWQKSSKTITAVEFIPGREATIKITIGDKPAT